MSHLRLVTPLPETVTTVAVPEQRKPWADDPKAVRTFFQVASGLCLCRECTKQRHPAYGAR
ncbi:MAG TPA: hypothetical protein VNQ77_03205 [Frankiaceae bacterium]|nr:hypothetical protein [Frankiaceae bacterium]